MKKHHYDSLFPKGLEFKNSVKEYKSLSPLGFVHDTIALSNRDKFNIPTPRFRKKIRAADLVFAANTEKKKLISIPEPKYTLNLGDTKRYNSHKLLPPLKATIHISTYSPRKPGNIESPSGLTVTFSSKQILSSRML